MRADGAVVVPMDIVNVDDTFRDSDWLWNSPNYCNMCILIMLPTAMIIDQCMR
jgi:hypothetical protein